MATNIKKFAAVGLLLAAAFPAFAVRAAEPVKIEPPLINLAPLSITNNEIFYLGGVATAQNASVVVYLQDESGAVQSREIQTDEQGAWFYSHEGFLKRGTYTVWTQLRVGESLSPPSPQRTITVEPAALQIGATRISFEKMYAVAAGALVLAIIALAILNIVHFRRLQDKKRRLNKEIQEAEIAVKRGFEILHKDITAELEVVRQMKTTRELSREEHAREEKMLKDLGLVESYITREVEDIERVV